jgi:hypothetical protein
VAAHCAYAVRLRQRSTAAARLLLPQAPTDSQHTWYAWIHKESLDSAARPYRVQAGDVIGQDQSLCNHPDKQAIGRHLKSKYVGSEIANQHTLVASHEGTQEKPKKV